MPILLAKNAPPAVIEIYVTDPETQAGLLDALKRRAASSERDQPGFVSACLHRSHDGQRVVNYLQWRDRGAAEKAAARPPEELTAGFREVAPPDVHAYEIFATDPPDGHDEIKVDPAVFINFGIFRVRRAEDQPRFMDLARQALGLVHGTPGLHSTYFHRSFDGLRGVNYGQWLSQAQYAAMVDQPPFGGPLEEMLSLADNEFQRTLHEVVGVQTATAA